MMNKKVLGVIIAALVSVTSTVTAFAADKTAKDPAAKVAKTEAKQVKQTEKAAKLGIDITGLSPKEAKAKINTAKTEKQSLKAEKSNSETTVH